MLVKCETCHAIIDNKEIEDIGGTGNKDVTEWLVDGTVINSDFIGYCPRCFTNKSTFNKIESEPIKNIDSEVKDAMKELSDILNTKEV